MAYLTMTTGGKLKSDIQRALRYIRAVEDQPQVKAWAEAEIAVIDKEFEELEKQLEVSRAETDKLRVKVKEAENRREGAAAERYLAQLGREERRVAELEHLVGRSQTLRDCDAMAGTNQMNGKAYQLEQCVRQAQGHCTKFGGACQYRWDGGGWTSTPPLER
jgi:hypothetical protein